MGVGFYYDEEFLRKIWVTDSGGRASVTVRLPEAYWGQIVVLKTHDYETRKQVKKDRRRMYVSDEADTLMALTDETGVAHFINIPLPSKWTVSKAIPGRRSSAYYYQLLREFSPETTGVHSITVDQDLTVTVSFEKSQ